MGRKLGMAKKGLMEKMGMSWLCRLTWMRHWAMAAWIGMEMCGTDKEGGNTWSRSFQF